MIRFFKKLLKDRRGNVIMIAGAALPLVVGAAGLATDTIQWAMWKRQLQRGADSAALAGVYAKVEANANQTAAQAVTKDLQHNNHTPVSLLAGYPQIAYPTSAGYTDAVRVTLAVQKTLGFSSLFLSNPPVIETSATAALVDEGEYCFFAKATSGPALIIQGSGNVQAGCGAISNSQDPTSSVTVNGNSHNFEADPVAAVGGISSSINGSPNVLPYQVAMQDPYENISTSVPSGTPCTNFNTHVVSQTGPNGQGGQVALSPGCYSTFNPGNHTYTLQPGTYYLDNANLSLAGSTRLVGDGVTIILTGNNPGSVSMTGTSSMDLSAPTTGQYANLLLIQSPGATTGNNNTINGDNNTNLDGVIYFPTGDLTFTGSTGQAFQCAMVIGYTLEFAGSATVQNNTSGCNAATTIQGKRVRLVA